MSVEILAVGDNVVDVYPARAVMYPGGNAVNVAVHARRCGTSSGYVGVVGTDAAAGVVLTALTEEGVDTTLTRVSPGANAHAVVHVVDGNRVFGSGDVGVSRFVLSADDLAAASEARLVHTGECSMLEDQLPTLARSARRLSFDFSERPWQYVRELAPLADVAIRSCPGISREAAVEEARRVQALGPDVVAVTLGADGAVLAVGDAVHQTGSPVAAVVDTLGAGDAFIGRLLTGLLRGEPPDEVVRQATAYATSTCTAFGAFGHETAVTQHQAPLDPVQSGGVDPS